MSARTPEERAMVARIASATRWARTPDRTAATEYLRNGLRAKFEREADPDGTLSPKERAYRADHLQRAHMARMSLKAQQARRKARDAQAARAPIAGRSADE